MTSVFFLLSGYVCAMKPLRLSRAGEADEARRVIASMAFRRIFRIVIPATCVTILSWGLAQLGAFELAGVGDYDQWGGWIAFTTPRRVSSFKVAVHTLILQCVSPIYSKLI